MGNGWNGERISEGMASMSSRKKKERGVGSSPHLCAMDHMEAEKLHVF